MILLASIFSCVRVPKFLNFWGFLNILFSCLLVVFLIVVYLESYPLPFPFPSKDYIVSEYQLLLLLSNTKCLLYVLSILV